MFHRVLFKFAMAFLGLAILFLCTVVEWRANALKDDRK